MPILHPAFEDANVAGVLCVPLISRNKVKILGAFQVNCSQRQTMYKTHLLSSVLQITALDSRRMWSLHDEEVLIGFVSVVAAALENLQNASDPSASNL